MAAARARAWARMTQRTRIASETTRMTAAASANTRVIGFRDPAAGRLALRFGVRGRSRPMFRGSVTTGVHRPSDRPENSESVSVGPQAKPTDSGADSAGIQASPGDAGTA